MGSAAPDVHTAYLVPWLTCRQRIDFGRVCLANLSWFDGRGNLPDGFGRLAETYRDQMGQPRDVALMWFTDREPTAALDDSDAEILRTHLEVLATAAIIENEYFNSASQPITAAHFEGYFQRFVPGETHVAIQRRRREGTNLGSWPISTLQFTVPSGAAAHAEPKVNQELLDSLAAGIVSSDELDERIQRSLVHFLDGNRLDDYGTARRDLVWLGAAFEHLLEISSPEVLRKLGDAMSNIFPSAVTPTSWSDWKGRPRTGSWLLRWTEEFYDHRGSVHTRPPHSSVWETWEHGLLATVVWGLALKVVLALAGKYTLNRRDENEIEALDERIAGGHPLRDRWDSAYQNATWALASRMAAARLAES